MHLPRERCLELTQSRSWMPVSACSAGMTDLRARLCFTVSL
jgi:hypothetical protein